MQPPVYWGPVVAGSVLPDASEIPMETGLRKQPTSTFTSDDETTGYSVPAASANIRNVSAATPMKTKATVHQQPAVHTLKVPQFLVNENVVVPPPLPSKTKAFSATKEPAKKTTLVSIARAVSAPPGALALPKLAPSKLHIF